MSDPTPSDHWNSLASELGAKPGAEPGKPPAAPPPATPPRQRSAPPAKTHRAPSSGRSNWNDLATSLGIDIPPEPPQSAPPAAERREIPAPNRSRSDSAPAQSISGGTESTGSRAETASEKPLVVGERPQRHEEPAKEHHRQDDRRERSERGSRGGRDRHRSGRGSQRGGRGRERHQGDRHDRSGTQPASPNDRTAEPRQPETDDHFGFVEESEESIELESFEIGTDLGEAPQPAEGTEPHAERLESDEPRRGRRRRRRGRRGGREGSRSPEQSRSGGDESEQSGSAASHGNGETQSIESEIDISTSGAVGADDEVEERMGDAAEGRRPRRRGRRGARDSSGGRRHERPEKADRRPRSPDGDDDQTDEPLTPETYGSADADDDFGEKSASRDIPNWAEVVGIIIEGNLQTRGRSRGGAQSGRGRGGNQSHGRPHHRDDRRRSESADEHSAGRPNSSGTGREDIAESRGRKSEEFDTAPTEDLQSHPRDAGETPQSHGASGATAEGPVESGGASFPSSSFFTPGPAKAEPEFGGFRSEQPPHSRGEPPARPPDPEPFGGEAAPR
jgi:hypothetical protein